MKIKLEMRGEREIEVWKTKKPKKKYRMENFVFKFKK